MHLSHTIFLAGVLMFCDRVAFSADDSGNFWRGGGTGGVLCQQFVATMEKSRSFGINSVKYVQETQGFEMYLSGFQTGYNMSNKNTCDIFNESDNYSLLSWIENFCRENSSMHFADGVIALSENRFPKRKKVCNN